MSAQHKAAFLLVTAVAETVRELRTVPSGELYARIMGLVDIHGYQKSVRILKGAGLVSEKGNVLTWVGPEV